MTNIAQNIKIADLSEKKMEKTPYFCYLVDFKTNNQILGIGAEKKLKITNCNNIDDLDLFLQAKKYKFGYLSYELKNCFEDLFSKNKDNLGFDLGHFFIPETVIKTIQNETVFHTGIHKTINWNNLDDYHNTIHYPMKPRLNDTAYFEAINSIKNHIKLGNIYETNFCYEFYQNDVKLDPFDLFVELSKRTNASFAAFCRFEDKYIISASPERFIKKEGDILFSQPIKGTRKAVKNEKENQRIIEELKNDPKERAENIMIVDLVRNDLSRIAKPNSVKVEELCNIHSFKNIHQMVSTISCKIEPSLAFSEILKATFPMGSMTGAPKISSMKLMEKYETTKRGLYSGSIGYFTPENDFDFNVIIRTFLYNTSNRYISFMVGGAITDKCNAENEYEETLIKANALLQAINNS